MTNSCRWKRWKHVAPTIMSIARKEHGQDADDAYQDAALTWHLYGDPTLLDAQIIRWLTTVMRRSAWRSRLRESLANEEIPEIVTEVTPYHIVSLEEIICFINQVCSKELRTACCFIAAGETQRAAATVVGWSDVRLSRELHQLRRRIYKKYQQPKIQSIRCSMNSRYDSFEYRTGGGQ